MNYDKVAKRLKLKFKKPRWNYKTGTVEFFTKEYDSRIGLVKINYNRGWKYHVNINEHDEDNFRHKHFGKKNKLIDYLVNIDAEYIQQYWSN